MKITLYVPPEDKQLLKKVKALAKKRKRDGHSLSRIFGAAMRAYEKETSADTQTP